MSAQTTSQAMIQAASPTIFMTDMARAVAFYTEILGLRLQYRAGDHFAMIDAGDGLSLGLHPPAKSAAAPAPGIRPGRSRSA
ncbi:MAG: VOC family protein [Phycisphaerae bacterium]